MGFWSGLGNVLKVGAPLAASFIPGVGPMASKILSGIGAGGEVLSNIGRVSGDAAQGVVDQRNVQNQQQPAYDRNKLERAALLERMGMDRAQMGITAPDARTSQVVRGDTLQNIQDFKTSVDRSGARPAYSSTGGLRPSVLGPASREAGGELSRQALMALMTKSDVPAMTDVPEMSDPKGSGVLEKTLGGVGLGGSILGGIGEYLKNRQKHTAPAPTAPVSGIVNRDLLRPRIG